MEHRISHDLNDELAKRAVEAAIDSYVSRFTTYNPTAQWTSDKRVAIRFAAKGLSLEGALTLEPGAVVFSMDVPFLMKPFAGKAKSKIEEHVLRWIDRARNGEL